MILDANVLEKCLRHLDFLGLYSDISHEGCFGIYSIGYHLNLTLPSKDQSSHDHFTARRRLRRKRTRRRKRRRRRKRTKARRETRLEFPAGVGGNRLSTWMSIPVGKWPGTIRNHRSTGVGEPPRWFLTFLTNCQLGSIILQGPGHQVSLSRQCAQEFLLQRDSGRLVGWMFHDVSIFVDKFGCCAHSIPILSAAPGC